MNVEIIDKMPMIIKNCYPITNDAVDLVEFIEEDDIISDSLLEIGAGSGYISIKLRNRFLNVVALDIQKESIENLKKNLENNNIENILAYECDILKYSQKHSVIVSNPPYFKVNAGKLPENKIKQISKFEVSLTMPMLIQKIKELLSENGVFYLIYPLDRKNELLKKVQENNMKILKIKEKGKRIMLKGTL